MFFRFLASIGLEPIGFAFTSVDFFEPLALLRSDFLRNYYAVSASFGQIQVMFLASKRPICYRSN